MPPRPREMPDGLRMGNNEGVLFVGEMGKLVCDCYGGSPRLIPDSRMRAYKQPPKTLPRSPGHHREWIDACKGGPPAGSNFDYAGPLTEMVLLGNVALRTGNRERNGYCVRLEWDAANRRARNQPDAERYIRPEFREGWGL